MMMQFCMQQTRLLTVSNFRTQGTLQLFTEDYYQYQQTGPIVQLEQGSESESTFLSHQPIKKPMPDPPSTPAH